MEYYNCQWCGSLTIDDTDPCSCGYPGKAIDLTPAMTPEEIETYRGPDTDFIKRLEEIKPEPWTPSTMGRKGGKAKSPAKTKACSQNGKKGGWPKGKPRGKKYPVFSLSCPTSKPE